MTQNFRCDCPITSALDVLGDKWMLVIVKQMLMEGKSTFKDFLESEEAIATNILSAKLKVLEHYGIVAKTKLPNNKKTNIYYLTERGQALTPVIAELATWSDVHMRQFNPTIREEEGIHLLRKDKSLFVEMLLKNYRSQLAQVVREA